MNKKNIYDFSQIPQIPSEQWGFIDDIKSPLAYYFDDTRACNPGENTNCLAEGICFEFDSKLEVPQTALISLDRVLAAKEIVKKDNSYKVKFEYAKDFEFEEFDVIVNKNYAILKANDIEGARRAIYAFEDLLCEAKGKAVMPKILRQKPLVKHRISRCFFGPTNRPPFSIDELTNDIDYYPEEYLNKLAHENVNGLWLTVYLKDYPTPLIPSHGKDAQKRYAKLRKVVEKCGKYGIKIYLFMCEPKLWGDADYCIPMQKAAEHPEMIGFKREHLGFFCTSSEAGKQYFRDTIGGLFSNVPNLGGIINIMYGEENGSCVSSCQIYTGTPINKDCPICSKYDAADVYADFASVILDTMHKYNPKAEYIGWFYAPKQRDDSSQSEHLQHIAEKFPKDCTFMLNFESGVAIEQLGKKRNVFDYSLACVGPSKLFANSCNKGNKMGAKLQVGCSHENATVPFMPVPENLYDKYKFMAQNNVTTAMQCWYFGNYPGLMNKAAGKLSFQPFPDNPIEFLEDLARPDWRSDAPIVAEAWHNFSMAYRNFPGNLVFEWYGPLHNSIVWPLHLYPVNEPIAPSWILKNFPEVSGDRIGESLGFAHTINESLELCKTMSNLWNRGLEKLLSLKEFYLNNPARLKDISLSQAIGLQMASTCNVLEFYSLREEMFFTKKDNLKQMSQLVQNEIDNSREMLKLCLEDCRLGYHSEAEGYQFFPAKLEGRIKLLEELLVSDFTSFDINSSIIDNYTNRTITEKTAKSGEMNYVNETISWTYKKENNQLLFEVFGVKGINCTAFLEINRVHPPIKIFVDYDGNYFCGGECFNKEPDFKVSLTDSGFTFCIHLDEYKEFIMPGTLFRFNIYGKDFAWVKHDAWPRRLTYGDTNPNCAGVLL